MSQVVEIEQDFEPYPQLVTMATWSDPWPDTFIRLPRYPVSFDLPARLAVTPGSTVAALGHIGRRPPELPPGTVICLACHAWMRQGPDKLCDGPCRRPMCVDCYGNDPLCAQCEPQVNHDP